MRMFAKCSDFETAAIISDQVFNSFKKNEVKVHEEPKPYWKIPEWYVFTFTFSPADKATKNEIISLSSHGWNHLNDTHDDESIWKKINDDVFVHQSVQWVHVALSV
jgi:hypothetical protein